MPTTQFQVDDNGLPDFEPVRFYDAPATILTQIWDGEGSLGRAIRTMMRSESLSPTERDSYAQRLKKSYGGNAVVDTTIDVATNPFTWLLLLTAPIGAKQFIASRGRLLQGLAQSRAQGRKTFVQVSELARTLQMSNLLNMGETQAPTLLAQSIISRWDVLSQLEGKVRGPRGKTAAEARAALMKKLGVDDLDYTRSTGDKKAVLHEIDVMANLWATGALEAGQVPYNLTGILRAAMFKPVTPNGLGAETPLLIRQQTFDAIKGKGKGARVSVDKQEYELVGDIVEAKGAQGLRKVLHLFPKKARETLGYRLTEAEMQNRFNVGGIDQTLFDKWAGSLGIRDELTEYLETGRRLRDEMKRRLFYKVDAAGNPLATNEIDAQKILNMWTKWQAKRNVKSPNLSLHEEYMDSIMPMEEIDKVLPQWVKEGARRGAKGLTSKKILQAVQEKMEPLLEHAYLPRNNYIVFEKSPSGISPIGPTHSDALVRRRESVMDSRGISALTLPRRGEGLPYNPYDLEVIGRIGQRFGVNPNDMQVMLPKWRAEDQRIPLAEAIRRMDRYLSGATNKGPNRAPAHSLGYEMNMRNYMRDATGTVILHGSQIPDNMYTLVQEALRNRAPQLAGARLGPPRPSTAMTPQQLEDMGLAGVDLKPDDALIFTLPESVLVSPAALRIRGRLVEAFKLRKSLEERSLAAAGTAKGIELEKRLIRTEDRIKGLKQALQSVGRRTSPPTETLLGGAKPYMTVDDVIETVMKVESPEVQEYFNRIILPGLFGGANPTSAFQLRMAQGARSMARNLASSGAGKWLEKNGGSMGQAVVRNLREMGDVSGYGLDTAYAQGGLTGLLYATHLGFNTVSAMWNLMQPLQWATTWMGGQHILHGYSQAFKQMGSYLTERISKHGLGRMDPEEKMRLWQKHVRLAGKDSGGRDLLGMGHDALSMLEGASFMRRPQGKPSFTKWLGIDVPLSLFQTAEAINRITVAEASMGWLGQLQRQSGMKLATNEVLDFAQLMQSMSNFNYNPITQLQLMQKGGVLGNSLIRMFLQYPSRTLSNFLVSNQLGGGTRSFGFSRFGGPSVEVPGAIGDLSRLLGTGAVAYEIGKNMLGLDLSSGLAGAAIGQLPNQFITQGIPIPPVIDIPTQLVSSIAAGDRDQFRQAAFRLVPGGLALQKALGAVPALPGGGSFGLLQQQYADWTNRTPDGRVPVYRNDGSLLAYESPFNLVMRGVGADFKRFKSPEEATKFLLSNRAEIIDLKRKYKDAVLGNNMALAQQVEAEYKKRYGIPMTIKPGEWERATKLREVPLFERMLETLPSDVRGPYQATLDNPEMAARAGLPEGALSQFQTSKQRQSLRAMGGPPTDEGG